MTPLRALGILAVTLSTAACGLFVPAADPPLASADWQPGTTRRIGKFASAEDIVVDPRTGTRISRSRLALRG